MENFYSIEDSWEHIYPTILPQWDRSPRAGKFADIYINSTPGEFKKSLLSVKNLIESAYFTMKGDTLLDTAKKIGTNSAIKNLKQSLRSTGVSKATKRINTTHSNSIFSRAVQLL